MGEVSDSMRDAVYVRDGLAVKPHRLAVLVVDDCCLYREGLTSLLGRDPEVTSVRSAADRPEANAALEEGEVDVVLVSMSADESLQLVTAIRRCAPATRTVAIGVGDNDSEIIACAETGVAGYVLRSQSFAHLMTVVHSVITGETVLSPRASAVLMRRLAVLAEERTERVPVLTDREDQILALLDRGLSNQEIADRLSIELRTVKNHVHNILAKLGVARRGEAVALMRGRRRSVEAASAGI
jgi:DNA-binding NarL/FixJ family response regulator